MKIDLCYLWLNIKENSGSVNFSNRQLEMLNSIEETVLLGTNGKDNKRHPLFINFMREPLLMSLSDDVVYVF